MAAIYTISSDSDDDESGPGRSKKLKLNYPKPEPLDIRSSLSMLPGNKCSFISCGKSRRDDPNLKQYKFPKDEALAKQWVFSSRDLSLLTWPIELLQKKAVCSEHFNDNDFVNPKVKKVLKKGVVPKPCETNLPLLENPLPSTSLDNVLTAVLSMPGQEELQPNEALSNNSSIFALEKHLNSENDINEPADEPEIKIETIINEDDMAKDPLQVCSIPKDIVVKKSPAPIIIRKIVNPPKELIKQIKQQNVKTFKGSNLSKLTPVQPVVKSKNPMKPSTVASNSHPVISHITVTVEKKNQEDIVKEVTSSENDQAQNSSEKCHNKDLKEVKDSNLCVVKGCTGNPTCYFKVPHDGRKIRIWRYCLSNPNLKVSDLICDQHFIQEDILSKPESSHIGVLKDHAVPSLRKILVGCCISQCINHNKNTVNMYPIPIWGNYLPWLNFMVDLKLHIAKLHDLQQHRVCNRHFCPQTLKRGFDMVPTLQLPSKEYYEEKVQKYLENRGAGFDKMSNITDIYAPEASESTSENCGIDCPNEFCTYLGCQLNKENAYFKFYKFPTDYDRAIKWIEACNRPDIVLKPRAEVEKFMASSIGVCFKHKNEVEKKIRRKEMNSAKAENAKNETSKFTIKVYQGKTEVEKSGGNEEELPTVNETDKNTNSSDSDQSSGEKTYVPTREFCAFVNCSTFVKDLVKKYRFPADKELLAEWIEAAGIPKTLSEDTLRTLFVCGKHFNVNQYTEMGTLILSSVPAPHTEFVDNASHEGNEHWILKQKKTQKKYVPLLPKPIVASSSTASPQVTSTVVFVNQMTLPTPQPASSLIMLQKKKCAVKHCTSNETTHMLFPFNGQDHSKFICWVKAVENKTTIASDVYRSYNNKIICSRHFEKRFQIGNNLLREDAMPTLDLVEEVPEGETDTSIVWKECDSDIFDTDSFESYGLHVKGNAILRANSIEFPNIRRELKFGKDCPKVGYLRKFPFKVSRITKKVIHPREVESINDGHKIQIHTAIIVDDDDESEREAIKVLSKIIMQNARLIPEQRPRGKAIKRYTDQSCSFDKPLIHL